MSIGRVDHTGVAVFDLDQALQRYEAILPGAEIERKVVPDQGVEVAFLRFGDTAVELLQPTSEASPVARFLARHGEGQHHVAFSVDDLKAELDRLAAAGVDLVDRAPRPGAHGLMAFIHPRALGVLIELVQHEL